MQNTTPASWSTPSSARWSRLSADTPSVYAGPGLSVWGPWALAAGLFFGLMFSFSSVVQQGVERAQQQRLLASEQGRAEQRCQAASTYGQRQACLSQLKADPQAATTLASLR